MRQYYGLTGRKIRPNYVEAINASTKYLPREKALKDEEDYRTKSLNLQTKRIDEETRLAQDAIDANREASDRSAMIGLGQLGVSTYQGAQRDKKLDEILSGGGDKTATGTVTPEVVASDKGSIGGEKYDMAAGLKPSDTAPAKTDFWSGFKSGASKWGPIATGAIVGGTAGADLGKKWVPIGGEKEKRIIGGAATAGALSYLASGDPYTAAISAIFGGGLGAFT